MTLIPLILRDGVTHLTPIGCILRLYKGSIGNS
jgi:hypothetical protein